MSNLAEYKKKRMQNPEFRAEYERLKEPVLSAEEIIRLFLSDDETIAEYTVGGEYVPGYCIVPADKDIMRIDLGGCLENTLHRLLEEKNEHPELDSLSPDDVVRMVMLADQDTDSDDDDEEDDRSFDIDLGYRLHGPILDIFAV
jgi:hypothetical protein